MNVFSKIYAYQYFELSKSSKQDEAHKNGVYIISVVILLFTVGTMFLAIGVFPDLRDYLEDAFEGKRGRGIGKIFVLIPFALIYLVVKFSYGTEKFYTKAIELFNELNQEEKEKVSDEGKRLLNRSVIFFIGAMAVFFLLVSIT